MILLFPLVTTPGVMWPYCYSGNHKGGTSDPFASLGTTWGDTALCYLGNHTMDVATLLLLWKSYTGKVDPILTLETIWG